VKKLLLAAAAGLLMAGCAEAPSAPTMPTNAAPGVSHKDGECRSGYIVAYDENGNPACVPVDGFNATRPTTTIVLDR
jgi:hypothetical protein